MCSKRWWLERHPSIEQHLLLLVLLWELDKQQKQTGNSLALFHQFSTSKALNWLHWHRLCSFLQSLHFSRTFFFFNVTWVTANVLPVERAFAYCCPKPLTVSNATIQLSASSFTKECRFLTLPSNPLSLSQSWYLTINCSFSFRRSDTYNESAPNSPSCPASHNLTMSVSGNSAKRSRSLHYLHGLHESCPVLPASLWALVFVLHIFALILQWLHCMQQQNNRDSERYAVPLPQDSCTTAAAFARMVPFFVSLLSGRGPHTMLQMNVCPPWISVLAVLLDLWRDLRHHLGLNVSVMLQHWPISMLPLVDRSHNQQ